MSALYDFLHNVEKLKNELRHSYTSGNRRESVAEHCWRLSLMILVLSENIPVIDKAKCLKMAVIHDLPEVFEGDSYRLDLDKQDGIFDREKAALVKLLHLLQASSGTEIMSLWLEFEAEKTAEARFVKLIDRLEVLIQHNESDISTWTDIEKSIHYGLAAKHAERYGYLADFAAEIDEETHQKLVKAGYLTQRVTQAEYEKYYGNIKTDTKMGN